MSRPLQSSAPPTQPWLLAATAWVLVAGAIASWITFSGRGTLPAQLVHLQFWTLESLFALSAGLTVMHARSLWRLAVGRPPADAATAWCLSATIAALVLATLVAPRTNRIYYDEQIYQNIGQNMADLRRAQICNDGSLEYGRLQCHEGEYNKQPYGYPHLLSVVYRIAGTRDGLAQRLNSLFSALLVVVVFLATAILFQNTAAASFAALVMAFVPEQLRWAATAAVEPSATFFAAFAVMTAAYFARTRTTAGLLWMVSASALAVQFRIESGLVLGVVALMVLAIAPQELRRPRTVLAAALGMLSLAPLLGHLVAVTDDPWGAQGPRTSLSYVLPNLSVNGAFYIADERFPPVYALLAVLGAATAQPRKLAAIVAGYFLAFFGVFLLFYAGSYDYGADVRFSLTTYPAVAILAGLGAATLGTWCSRTLRLPAARAHAVVCAFIVLQFSWYLPYVRAIGEEAWEARVDVEFARTVSSTVPSDGYLFSHNPNMFHVLGTSSAQTAIAADRPGYVGALLERYRGGVYFHWGFWCNVQDEAQRNLCRRVLELYDLEVVAERRHWYQRYALYRIKDARAAGATGKLVEPPGTLEGGYNPPAPVDGDAGPRSQSGR